MNKLRDSLLPLHHGASFQISFFLESMRELVARPTESDPSPRGQVLGDLLHQ